jgi:hypothetical protein
MRIWSLLFCPIRVDSLSVAQAMLRKMVEWLVKSELERICKDEIVSYFKVLPRISPGETEENSKRAQNSRYPDRDSNSRTPQ